MENRTTSRYGWELTIVLALGDTINAELRQPERVVALCHRAERWRGKIEHNPEKSTITFTGTVYAPDFKDVDREVSDVLYALGAAPNRVVVLSAVRGNRVTL